MYFFDICISTLVEHLFKYFVHLFVRVSVFFLFTFVKFLYSGYKTFIRYMICKYFLPMSGLSFNSLNSVFGIAEMFNFEKSNLLVCSLMDYSFVFASMESSPDPRSQGFSPVFYSRSFTFYS